MRKYCTGIITILILLQTGCTNHIKEIETILEDGRYCETIQYIDNLPESTRSEMEIQKLLAYAEYKLLLDMALYGLERDKNNEQVENMLELREKWTHLPDMVGKMDSVIKIWSNNAIDYKISISDYSGAYKFIQNIEQRNLGNLVPENKIRTIRMGLISGIWVGKSEKRNLTVRMRLDAITSTRFTGRVHFEEVHILTELENGHIEKDILSAVYSIRISRGRYVREAVTGKIQDGKLYMEFSIVVTERDVQHMGGGGYGIGYTSRIVKEKVVMEKEQ